MFAKLLSDKTHEIHNIFRFSGKTFSQFRILCSDTNRTCIQVADTHHDASHRYQWSCSKTEFLCTKHCRYSNITTTHEFSVCLNADFISQAVHDQCLMRLSETKLPRKSCIVDGTSRCSTGSSVITRNQDNLCTGFCNTGCDSSDTCF